MAWKRFSAPRSDAPADARDELVASPSSGRGDTEIDAAVIAPGSDAVTFGSALAGELRARSRSRTALLLVWDPAAATPPATPAWRAARRLAAALSGSHDVAARGRLVRLQLPHDATAAAAAATRLTGSARVPTVVVLGGPRSAAFDGLLSSLDLLVVLRSAECPSSLTDLAVAQLRQVNDRIEVERPIVGSARRALAACGLGRARSLGARLREPLA